MPRTASATSTSATTTSPTAASDHQGHLRWPGRGRRQLRRHGRLRRRRTFAGPSPSRIRVRSRSTTSRPAPSARSTRTSSRKTRRSACSGARRPSSGSPATIVSGQTVTIDVTNTLVKKPGSIQINKAVTGAPEGFDRQLRHHTSTAATSGRSAAPSRTRARASLTINGVDHRRRVHRDRDEHVGAPGRRSRGATSTSTNNPATIPAAEITIVTHHQHLVRGAGDRQPQDHEGHPRRPGGLRGQLRRPRHLHRQRPDRSPRSNSRIRDSSPSTTSRPARVRGHRDQPERSARGLPVGPEPCRGPVTIGADQTAEITVTNLLTEQQAGAGPHHREEQQRAGVEAGGVEEGDTVTYTLDYTAATGRSPTAPSRTSCPKA